MMEETSAFHVEVNGVVQGVGFRPFVYGLAARLGLTGWVLNTSSGVVIEVEGPSPAVEDFLRDLEKEAPPLSRIERVDHYPIPPNGSYRFEIRESKAEAGYVLVSPDMATCGPCLEEIFDPGDRRYRYPFTNCTNCGPRFTILKDVPYDRPLTTMAPFRMCSACRAEYDNPLDRRFHAQPNACPVCGPKVWFVPGRAVYPDLRVPPEEREGSSSPLKEAAGILRSGAILALKGLGGFHLACDATRRESVRTLRKRKKRPHKPLAVMMPSVEEIRRHCLLSEEEERLLRSPSCPIVLLEWKNDSTVVRDVAPGNGFLGVMLPYTPLHHLLLHDTGRPLVMTSGNLSEEPIAQSNEEAWERLRPLADGFLFHNRDIHARYDDSVWFVPDLPVNRDQSIPCPAPLRRSRGYAPFPIKLPFTSIPLLACGPELKNTFCITRDRYGFVSQHIGDLENLETLEHFETSITLYEKLFRIKPEVLICDLHPDYLSTRYAIERSQKDLLPLFEVQHHHAHIASCLVDLGQTEPVIGVALDGTGLGLDGSVWGGEWLISDLRGFRRAAWLEPLPLPGGDAGIRNPGRIAMAYLCQLFGEVPPLPFQAQMEEDERKVVRLQVEKGIHRVMTSSAGRLFDAVSAMAGGPVRVSYEAQAAIEMEMVSKETRELFPYDLLGIPETFAWGDTSGLPSTRSSIRIGLGPLILSVVDAVCRGRGLGDIGGTFHRTLAKMIAEVSGLIAGETGIKSVALSGGCFQNRMLLRMTVEEIRRCGLSPLLHRLVPSNDGCVSLGQAAIGYHRIKG